MSEKAITQPQHVSRAGIIFGGFAGLTTWIALILQFYLRKGSLTNFFSFFTIECNILVAICLTCIVAFPSTAAGKYFRRPSVQTGVGLYIFIVGFIYNLVLRKLYSYAGIQAWVDDSLHVFVPVLFLLYWILFTEKINLPWKVGFNWIIFPLLYLVYTLVRGSMVQWYPYPFLNVTDHGYPKIFTNIFFMLILFLLAGFILVFVCGMINKRVRSK